MPEQRPVPGRGERLLLPLHRGLQVLPGSAEGSEDGYVSLCRKARSWLPHPSIHECLPVREGGVGLGV